MVLSPMPPGQGRFLVKEEIIFSERVARASRHLKQGKMAQDLAPGAVAVLIQIILIIKVQVVAVEVRRLILNKR